MISGALQARALARVAPIAPPPRVRDYIRVEEIFLKRTMTLPAIKRAVSAHFNVSVADLDNHDRSQPLAWARQVGIYLACDFTRLSGSAIGRKFGGRHHTTVLHARKHVDKRLKAEAKVRREIDAVQQAALRLIRQVAA